MADSFIAQIILPMFLGLVMIGVGTSLTKKDFQLVLKKPKAVLLGLLGQMIFLPLIGISLCYFFRLPPELAIGLILVACSPGGVSSNIMSFISKADTSLSVTITSISNVAAILTMPVIFNLSARLLPQEVDGASTYDVVLPFWGTFLRLLLVILLPIVIGIRLNSWNPELCRQFESKLRSFAGLFFSTI